MTGPKVFILVLNWNSGKLTVDCLRSLFSAHRRERIVVIDNGSTDDSLALISGWAADVDIPVASYDRGTAEQGGSPDVEQRIGDAAQRSLVLVRSGANRGFAGGNNIGIRYALARGADYVLLLNNDAFFRAPGSLDALLHLLEREPRAGACGGRLFYPDGRPQQSYGNFPALSRILASLFPLYRLLPPRWLGGFKRSNVVPDPAVTEPMKVDWPSGACLLARARMIRDVGLLDERYFLFLEETDWCRRMAAAGWDRYYVPQAEVVHLFGGSSPGTAAIKRIHLQSQFIYYEKHFSRGTRAIAAAGYLARSLADVAGGAVRSLLVGSIFRRRTGEASGQGLHMLGLSGRTLLRSLLPDRAAGTPGGPT